MRITLIGFGTRGDIQPYVCLGWALQRRGHDITVAAPLNMASLVRAAGLRCCPLPIDVQELQVQLERVRRRIGLVIAITLIAVVGAVVYSVASPVRYTGTSTLIVSSGARAEEDAVLAQGYVEYINEPSAQDALLQAANLTGVDFEARTGASSPIVYIDAVADNSFTVKQDTAAAINVENFAGAMRALAELRAPVDAFFDKVTVNVADGPDAAALRANRLALLSEIRAATLTVADFSRIAG